MGKGARARSRAAVDGFPQGTRRDTHPAAAFPHGPGVPPRRLMVQPQPHVTMYPSEAVARILQISQAAAFSRLRGHLVLSCLVMHVMFSFPVSITVHFLENP